MLPKLGAPDRADLSGWKAEGMRASATGAVDFSGVDIQPIEVVGRDGDYERRARGASLRCISVAWRDCSIFFGDTCRKPTAEGIRTRRRVWAAPQLPLKRRGFGWRRPRPSRKLLWDQGYRSSLSPTSILRALRLRRRLSILCSLSQRSVGLQAFLRPNPIERISRDLATYLRQPGPDRARADAATWILAQSLGVQDLWR